MPDRSISVSISIPVELDEEIREKKDEYQMNYSEYIRHCVRSHPSNRMDEPKVHLVRDENGDVVREEGAA